jgi:hypothetical protein
VFGVQKREDCAFGSTGREVTTCDIAESDPLPCTACVVGDAHLVDGRHVEGRRRRSRQVRRHVKRGNT